MKLVDIMNKVRFKVEDNIWRNVMMGGKKNVIDNVAVNVSVNVRGNVCNRIKNNVEDTSFTDKQLSEAYSVVSNV